MRYDLENIKDIREIKDKAIISGDLREAEVGDEFAIRFGSKSADPIIYNVIRYDGQRYLVSRGYQTYRI